LKKEGHYFGAHSDQHLLYANWSKRDSLLVSEEEFKKDLENNYSVMKNFGITKKAASLFLPPYEWYNDSIIAWSAKESLRLINYSAGTLSHTDYTDTAAKNYRSTQVIWNSILDLEEKSSSHLNGFILLMHIGAGPGRRDKFFHKLPALLNWLKLKGYKPVRIDELLN
jgi:peptidoglycan/xylan/chitin deacetylase (PgdA/CDA1 family)